MPLPIPGDTTCDIYRSGNTPPAAPDVKSVPCQLHACFAQGVEQGEADSLPTIRWDHWMFVALETDVRDGYSVGSIGTYDTVYVPNQDGVPYRVRFVERTSYGQGRWDMKRVYLAREQPPSWPHVGI